MPVCLSLIAFFLHTLDGPYSDWDFQREKHGLSPIYGASQVALVVKNPSAIAGNLRDAGSIPGSGRSPGRGQGNALQYPCLQNPMDREAWWATDHGVTKSQTWLKQLSTCPISTGTHRCFCGALLNALKRITMEDSLKWQSKKKTEQSSPSETSHTQTEKGSVEEGREPTLSHKRGNYASHSSQN